MSRAFIFILLAVLLFFGGFAVDAAFVESGENIENVNETWTPDPGNVTVLEDSNIDAAIYSNETTVYNTSGTPATTVDEGDDYVWYESNGTVKAVQGGALDGVSDATITYSYERPSSDSRTLADNTGYLLDALVGVLFLFGLVFLIGILRGGGF